MNILQKLKKLSQLHKYKKLYHDEQRINQMLSYNLTKCKEENDQLKYGNNLLKEQHEALLKQGNSQYKRDLNESINIIIDYQKTLFRATLPDPNVQRASHLLNKWNVKSERTHNSFKIMAGGRDITMGREF